MIKSKLQRLWGPPNLVFMWDILKRNEPIWIDIKFHPVWLIYLFDSGPAKWRAGLTIFNLLFCMQSTIAHFTKLTIMQKWNPGQCGYVCCVILMQPGCTGSFLCMYWTFGQFNDQSSFWMVLFFYTNLYGPHLKIKKDQMILVIQTLVLCVKILFKLGILYSFSFLQVNISYFVLEFLNIFSTYSFCFQDI